MQFNAHLLSQRPPGDELLAGMLPAHDYPRSNGWCAVPLTDPALARVLAAGDDAGGLMVGGETVLGPDELRNTSHFELQCRLLTRERPRDTQHNLAVVKATPMRDAGGYLPIRLPEGFMLTRPRLKPNAAAMIGDWTGEYVLGPAATAFLLATDLSGWSLRPVFDGTPGHPCADGMQLFSEAILRPALFDASVNKIVSRHPEEKGHRQTMGCLAWRAADLAGSADVNRTAEPWASFHGMPTWIVTRKFVDLWQGNGLRGWRFRPVLIGESDLYPKYIEAWRTLRALVASTASSHMHAGRW